MMDIIQRLIDRTTNRFLLLNYRVNAQQLIDTILMDARYQDPKRLEQYGFKAYSQNDEDGIISEIFKRIGIKNYSFVEFGAAKGLENNTLYLLYQGWTGLWIEGGKKNCNFIRNKFASAVSSSQLKLTNAFITRDNINQLFTENEVIGEIDLLSIDIDGNDYHIWETIDVINPRVIVIEYNAKFRPPAIYVMEYNPNHTWKYTDYFNASLKSLEKLGNCKGYKLVGCNITGLNAFFVREDLIGDLFQEPFTAENFYQPPRYYLTPFYASAGGHKADFGLYIAK
jgi:hypothetical protein